MAEKVGRPKKPLARMTLLMILFPVSLRFFAAFSCSALVKAAELVTSTVTGTLVPVPSFSLFSSSISTFDSFELPEVKSVEAFLFLTKPFLDGWGKSLGRLGVNGGSTLGMTGPVGDLERALKGIGCGKGELGPAPSADSRDSVVSLGGSGKPAFEAGRVT